jgi:hypothetical protein
MLSTEIPFQEVLNALCDEANQLPPSFLHRLSDLPPNEVMQLDIHWPLVPLWRRQVLMEDLEQLTEADLLLSFEAIGRLALRDSDPRVRTSALYLLWDYDLDDLLPNFIRLMETDADPAVRATAAALLGRFVLLGETALLEKPPTSNLQNRLLNICATDPDVFVRRCALESVSYANPPEISPLIEQAFASGDRDWVACALVCAGRSMDEHWSEQVLSMLDHKIPLLRAEAARAAGEMELTSARARLFELLRDSDDEVHQAAIWSLSQIGGEGVRAALERLWRRADDDDEIALLEEALDNLAFTENSGPFTLLEIDEEESAGAGQELSLEEDEYSFDEEEIDLLSDEEIEEGDDFDVENEYFESLDEDEEIPF